MQLLVLNVSRPQACNFPRVIPEIDIWRAANLMLKRYGDNAPEESATRVDELRPPAMTRRRDLAPDHRRMTSSARARINGGIMFTLHHPSAPHPHRLREANRNGCTVSPRQLLIIDDWKSRTARRRCLSTGPTS
jgi:hypothetical protein